MPGVDDLSAEPNKPSHMGVRRGKSSMLTVPESWHSQLTSLVIIPRSASLTKETAFGLCHSLEIEQCRRAIQIVIYQTGLD